MLKTLVSLNADLASSIAFRYCCRLAEFADIKLQTIHVEQMGKDSYPPGSGWVRSTWEKGLTQTAQDEISQLIDLDKASCPKLDPPIIRLGERENVLLHEIEDGSYDLYLEGILSSFNTDYFLDKLRSKLYKYAPCPIILVKNLISPNRVVLLIGKEKDAAPLISVFLKIFNKSAVTLDLIYFTLQRSTRSGSWEKINTHSSPGIEGAEKSIRSAKAMLKQSGWDVKDTWIVQDNPKGLGESLGHYGLVGVCIPRDREKNRIFDLLSRVPTATLLCKR